MFFVLIPVPVPGLNAKNNPEINSFHEIRHGESVQNLIYGVEGLLVFEERLVFSIRIIEEHFF